ncbi:hypothetical protein ACS0TY_001484 [Phlomoides rotata]
MEPINRAFYSMLLWISLHPVLDKMTYHLVNKGRFQDKGIHKRWDVGYRVTSTAATWDQAAIVLSVPRRKLSDQTQETHRTSPFPSRHVKEKWAKNLYIAFLCYEITVRHQKLLGIC